MDNTQELVQYFYENVVGFANETGIPVTTGTIQWLLDCGYSPTQIRKIMDEVAPKEQYLSHSDLPDTLWQGSLIERNRFYYNHRLQIRNSLPVYKNNGYRNSVYYCEPRIWFTLQDLMRAYYDKHGIADLRDPVREEGFAKHLLDKYSRISFVSALDFVLHMIDIADRVTDITELRKYEAETYQSLEDLTKRAQYYNYNRIVWRTTGAEKNYVAHTIRRTPWPVLSTR